MKRKRHKPTNTRAKEWAMLSREQVKLISEWDWEPIKAAGKVVKIERNSDGFILAPEIETGYAAFYEAEPGRAYLYRQNW